MRVARSIRLNKNLDEKLNKKADKLNITRSKLIELACSLNLQFDGYVCHVNKLLFLKSLM